MVSVLNPGVHSLEWVAQIKRPVQFSVIKDAVRAQRRYAKLTLPRRIGSEEALYRSGKEEA